MQLRILTIDPRDEDAAFENSSRRLAETNGVQALEAQVELVQKRMTALLRVLEDEYDGNCPHCGMRKGKSMATCGRSQCATAQYRANRDREGHMRF